MKNAPCGIGATVGARGQGKFKTEVFGRMKSNNKRVAGLILCLLCLAALLASCDPAAGKRPVDYPNSRWVCEDPHIEIVVDEKGRYTSTLIGDDGEETRFSVPDMEWMPMQTEKLSLVMRHCCFGETVSYQKTDLQFKFARTIFGTALIPN